MTVKEILKKAITFLGLDELLLTNIFALIGGGEPTTAQSATILKLLNCLNYVSEDIATEVFPLIKTSTENFENNRVSINNISSNFVEVISVTENGIEKDFYIEDGFLYCETSSAVVKYRTFPNAYTINDDVETFNNRISSRIFAYGVCMEYCFISALSDEASIWEKRFKDALVVLSQKHTDRKLPRWRW